MSDVPFHLRVVGAALGQAAGDAFGFQVERGGPRAATDHVQGWLPSGDGPEPMRDGYRLGQVSDDTQCARILIESALAGGGHDPVRHAAALVGGAGDLVGAGSNTLRMLKALSMTAGFPSGDLPSALAERGHGMVDARHQPTNGVVMRAWPHAVLHADRTDLARAVLVDGILTHAHPEAGSCAVTAALATRLLFEGVAPADLFEVLRDQMPDEGETGSLDLAERLHELGEAAADHVWAFAGRPELWRSVAPLALTTVAWSLHAFRTGAARGPNAVAVLSGATCAGGDVDTTAALALGWLGAAHGPDVLPAWLVGKVNDRGRWRASDLSARAEAFARLGVAPHPRVPSP